MKGFEETIRRRVSENGLRATKISCPPDVEVKPGARFTCQVELDGKKTYALDVTLKKLEKTSFEVDLDTAWRDGSAVVVARLDEGLTKQLSEQLGNPVTVKCGDEPLRFLDPQHKLRCELSADTVKSSATIDFDDKLEPTGYHLDPPLLGRAKLEELLTPAVREKTTPSVKIDCGPSALLARPADGVVWCSISDAGKQAKLKVEVDGELNVQRWAVTAPPK